MLRSLLAFVVVGGCFVLASAGWAQPAQPPRPVQPDTEASPSDTRPPVAKGPVQSPVQAPSVKGGVVQASAPANCGKGRRHRRCR